ncbi:M16 family metallopeptidase [Coralliovum pocilloporae]|uniref:M16 family metallopeptidase n=1 Tax=Coralliovum pocilloporae TaxID=3066369 RepID=UPI0033077823
MSDHMIHRHFTHFTLAIVLLVVLMMPRMAQAADIQEVTSASGIKAWLVEEHSVPIVAINFAFRGGSAHDPAGREGLANLTTALIDEGSGETIARDFQQQMQEQALKMSYSVGRGWFYGTVRLLKQNQDESLALVNQALTSPRFDQDAVDRIRAQIISGIRSDLKNPDAIASRSWFQTAFPDHPYGRPSKGTEDSVTAITRDDLVDFHKRVFTRDHLTVSVVGAISAEELKEVLDTLFVSLPAEGQVTSVDQVQPKLEAGLITSTLDVPQTTIQFGGKGLKRKDPDYLAAHVANHILGGGSFTSRLYNEVREKRGLVYSVFTTLLPYDHTALYFGGLGTSADQAQQAIDVVRAEIDRMAAEGPTEEELEKAKKFLIGSYPLRFDSSSKIARQLLGIQIEDLGIDYIDQRNSLIEAITIEDVKRAAKRVFGSDILVTTVGPQNS